MKPHYWNLIDTVNFEDCNESKQFHDESLSSNYIHSQTAFERANSPQTLFGIFEMGDAELIPHQCYEQKILEQCDCVVNEAIVPSDDLVSLKSLSSQSFTPSLSSESTQSVICTFQWNLLRASDNHLETFNPLFFTSNQHDFCTFDKNPNDSLPSHPLKPEYPLHEYIKTGFYQWNHSNTGAVPTKPMLFQQSDSNQSVTTQHGVQATMYKPHQFQESTSTAMTQPVMYSEKDYRSWEDVCHEEHTEQPTYTVAHCESQKCWLLGDQKSDVRETCASSTAIRDSQIAADAQTYESCPNSSQFWIEYLTRENAPLLTDQISNRANAPQYPHNSRLTNKHICDEAIIDTLTDEPHVDNGGSDILNENYSAQLSIPSFQKKQKAGRIRFRNQRSFPSLLMQAVQKCDDPSIVSWLPDGKSIVIIDQKRFLEMILARSLVRGKGSSKYSSFIRKLQRYGFIRLVAGTGVDCFHHPNFNRDNPEMAARIQSIPPHYSIKIQGPIQIGVIDTESSRPSLDGIQDLLKLQQTA